MMTLRFQQTFRERAMEWALSCGMLGFGLILLQAGPVFDRPFFTPLARIMPQIPWGITLGSVGLLRFIALVINGSSPRGTPALRQLGCVVGMAAWSSLVWGSLSLDWVTPATSLYIMIFLMDALSLGFAAADGKGYSRGANGHGSS